MSNTNTGGPAFPSGIVRKSRPAHDPGADFHVTDFTEPRNAGMTMRDYFAAKAMQTLLGSEYTSEHGLHEGWMGALAHESYMVADAMMKARQS